MVDYDWVDFRLSIFKSVLDFLHYLFNVVTKLISPSLNSPNRSQPTHLETQL